MVRIFALLALTLIVGEGVRLWWFNDSRAGTSPAQTTAPSLRFNPDISDPDAGSIVLHHSEPRQEKIVDRLLGHDRSQCGVWQEGTLPVHQIHYTWVEYDPGNTRYLRDLFGHPPEVCMGKSGATPVAVHPDRVLKIADREISVRHVEFIDPMSAAPFHIFKFAWLPEDSALTPGREGMDDLRLARLHAAAHGMPRTEAKMLLAMVFGASGPEDGWQSFERTMSAALSIEPAEGEAMVSTHIPD